MSIYPFLTCCLLILSMAEQGLSHPTQRRGATRPPDLGSLPPLPGLLPLTKHASHSQGLILQQFCLQYIFPSKYVVLCAGRDSTYLQLEGGLFLPRDDISELVS